MTKSTPLVWTMATATIALILAVLTTPATGAFQASHQGWSTTATGTTGGNLKSRRAIAGERRPPRRHKPQQQLGRPTLSPDCPLFVSQSQSDATTSSSSSPEEPKEQEEGAPWWKDHEMEDPELPTSVRPQFPILASRSPEGTPLVYLDSGATSQKPRCVLDALDRYYTEINSNVHRGAHRLSREATAAYEEARDEVSRFVNANSRNEIVFTSGATESINLVASSWGRANLGPGDEVVITVAEHHSNIVPWQMITKETGATLKYIPIKTDKTGDHLDWDYFFSDLLSDKTKMVSFQHVSNVLGTINPVADIASRIRDVNPNTMILVDACQSVPQMPVDVRSLGVDFLAASGHKMCGPTGIGFLWGREELLNSMPPYMGGGEMINDVFLDHSTYAPAPGRFEAGTPPIGQAVGMGAACKFLAGVGMERVSAYEHELARYLHERLADSVDGVRVLGVADPTLRAGVVAFDVDGVHPSDLSTFLDMEGVAIRAGHHCCQPLHRELGISHSARASLYIYNTKEDIDYFIEKLQETVSFFRSMGGSGGDGGENGASGGEMFF